MRGKVTHCAAHFATLQGLAWSSARTLQPFTGRIECTNLQPFTGIGNLQPFTGIWRGRTHERLVKLQFFMCIEKFATLHWRGLTHERLAKLKLLMCIEAKFATLYRDWRGRTHERKVKLLLSMRIEAKFATLHKDWRRGRTSGTVATFDAH